MVWSNSEFATSLIDYFDNIHSMILVIFSNSWIFNIIYCISIYLFLLQFLYLLINILILYSFVLFNFNLWTDDYIHRTKCIACCCSMSILLFALLNLIVVNLFCLHIFLFYLSFYNFAFSISILLNLPKLSTTIYRAL